VRDQVYIYIDRIETYRLNARDCFSRGREDFSHYVARIRKYAVGTITFIYSQVSLLSAQSATKHRGLPEVRVRAWLHPRATAAAATDTMGLI